MKIKYNLNNTTFLNSKIGQEKSTLSEYSSHLKNILNDSSYSQSEASLYLPLDSTFITQSLELSEVYISKGVKYLFIVGIGGSNLGAQAIYYALKEKIDQRLKVVFLDTLSKESIKEALDIIAQLSSASELVINIISKSGGTTESITIAEILITEFQSKFENTSSQIVVTTDKNSKLDILAKEKQYSVLNLPKQVGGRYSVFSNVGLFPLSLMGVDVENLLEGAKVPIVELMNSTDTSLTLATVRYLAYLEGFFINNYFIFNPTLEFLGKWCRQLVAESLGKEKNLSNEVVNLGILPIVSIGSTDLHSMVQLYLGGPKKIFTNFIFCNDIPHDYSIQKDTTLALIIPSIDGKKLLDIQNAIYKGTVESYIKRNLPIVETELHKIDEYSLGMFMQSQMIETMYLARFMNLNAFDQPNVEEYKVITKQLLSS